MTKIEAKELLNMGVMPTLMYEELIKKDINKLMSVSFKGGDIMFANDGSNYSRQVFRDALSKARLLSN